MGLLAVAEARARILAGVEPTGAESVPLAEASGRILAGDLASTRDQPPFDASAMDGYAVRAEDVAETPVRLRVIGEASAGSAFSGSVAPGEAVRIFTGAPMPTGTDTVVIQENTTRDGDIVTMAQPSRAGRFVRRRSLDFAKGETLLAAGIRLGTRELALAASMNHPRVPVRRRPRVAILATGDELVPPGAAPRDDQIISSNSFGLLALVAQAGGEAVDLGISGDALDALTGAIGRARDADVLVTMGGASVGDHDLVHRALVESGMEPDFWKIAMRPGKPLMFGRLGATRVLGLPGNPVSSFVCSYLFLRPLLEALLGRLGHRLERRAVLGEAVPANDEREDYLRASLHERDDGTLTATAFLKQDSSMLRMLTRADCLLVRPPHDPERPAGYPVTVLPIDF